MVKLYTLPKGTRSHEATIRMGNPAFGMFLNAREVLAMANDKDAAQQAEFENLILNRRVESTNAFIAPEAWKGCGESLGSLDGLTL